MTVYQGDRTLWRQVRAEKKRRNYVFWTFMLLSLIYMCTVLLLSDMGYLKYRKLRNKTEEIKTQIAQVRDENQKLKRVLQDYRKNGYLMEKHAREEYGLAKKDEYIFLFEDEKKP